MKLITREFNMDSGCVELRFDDGTELNIDCTAVENKYGHTMGLADLQCAAGVC